MSDAMNGLILAVIAWLGGQGINARTTVVYEGNCPARLAIVLTNVTLEGTSGGKWVIEERTAAVSALVGSNEN